jgi:hypothetical protein
VSSSLTNPKTFTGAGHAGVWNDPLNWANGAVPGATDFALVPKSAVLNGPIEVSTLMLLGNETVSVNGEIKTDSLNTCESFMDCEGAVTTFNAGSSLLDAGGFIVGIDAPGTVIVDGASGGKAAATLDVAVVKIGQHDDGVGTLSLAGTLNVTGAAYIGVDGAGTVNVTSGGSANFVNLVLGELTGGVGKVSLSGNASVYSSGWLSVGTSQAGAPGGVGTLTIGGHASVACDHRISVASGSAIAMAGGSMIAGPDGDGLHIGQGGTISGYGSVSAGNHAVRDDGLLASAGGTLLVTGNIYGIGAVQVGSGSTLDLNASRLTLPSIAFLGTGDTLGLVTGVLGSITLTGFGVGDNLVMSGIDGANWNGTAGILTLTEGGHAMDQLHLTGVASNAVFHVTPGSEGSVITLMPALTSGVHG